MNRPQISASLFVAKPYLTAKMLRRKVKVYELKARS